MDFKDPDWPTHCFVLLIWICKGSLIIPQHLQLIRIHPGHSEDLYSNLSQCGTFTYRASYTQTPNAYMYGRDSANGSHTVCREPKFVGFCANTKRTGCARCPFRAPGVLCSPQVRKKLINRAPLIRRMRTAQLVCGALVYTKLNMHHIYCIRRPLLFLSFGARTTDGCTWLGTPLITHSIPCPAYLYARHTSLIDLSKT